MTDQQAGSGKDRIAIGRFRVWSSGLARAVLSAAAAGALVTALACAATARPDKAGMASPAPAPPAGATAGASAAPAATPVKKQAAAHGPSIVVAGGTTFDFGKIWPTKENLKHTFKLTNNGDAELKILHVQPG